MLTSNDLVLVGQLRKAHGIRGEVACTVRNDLLETIEPPFIFVEIDSTYIPFRVDSYRYKNDDTLLLTLPSVTTEQQLSRLLGCNVWIEKSIAGDIDLTYNEDDLVGYQLLTADGKPIGEIQDIDTSTANVIMQIEGDIVLPLHEDLVVEIIPEEKQLIYRLPEGLL